MDKFERGRRAGIGIYDDACSFTDEEMKLFGGILSKNSVDTGINIFDDSFWFMVDDGIEMVVPYLGLLHGKIPEGRYDNIINELNSLGCTSFIITSEQIKSLLDEKDDD